MTGPISCEIASLHFASHSLHTQTAMLLMRIDAIVSGMKKNKGDSSQAAMPSEEDAHGDHE